MDQFWIAKVPKSGVQQVIFRIDRFKSGLPFVGAAHTLMRFKMQPGSEIQLTPQTQSTDEQSASTLAACESILILDFFFSVDYMAPPGIAYGLVQGEEKTFLTTERFISERDRDAGVDPADSPSQDLPLIGLDAASMASILVNAVHRSSNRAISYPYNTFDYNCTTELFNLLDDSLNYGDREVSPFKVTILDASDAIAGPSIKALLERGLILPDEADDSSAAAPVSIPSPQPRLPNSALFLTSCPRRLRIALK